MRTVQISLAFFHLTCSTVAWISNLVNQTKLETEYTDYCGTDSLCSLRNSSIDNIQELYISMNCPQCSCDHDCEVSGKCCPDKTLSTCVQPIYSFTEDILRSTKSPSYLMVSKCPQGDGQVQEDCSLNIEHNEFQHLAPVVSLKTGITYMNSKCSKCHGEDIVVKWAYSLSCVRSYLNLNTYSNVNDLLKDLREQRCSIDFHPPKWMYPVECREAVVISECNHTGEWDFYDKDIATACKDIWNPYGVFRNVFCFLCNTNVNKRNEFKVNTNRGIEESYETIVTDACSENCDEYLSASNGDILIFRDMTVSLSEFYQFNYQEHRVYLNILSWDVIENIRSFLRAQDVEKKTNIESQDGNVNLTALYEEYVLSGGYQDWCDENFQANKIYPGIKSRRMCSCDQSCYLSSTCCPDIAYHHPMACVYPSLGLDKTNDLAPIFLISRCPINYTNHYVKTMCEISKEFEIFSIPVINVNSNKSYKNHFCYLCHNQGDIENNTVKDIIRAFNISLECPSLLYPNLMPSMESLLKSAKQGQCSIKFSTVHKTESCFNNRVHDPLKIKACNFTGKRKSISSESQKLCEDPLITAMAMSRNELYKNEICDMCNSEIFEDAVGVCVSDSIYFHPGLRSLCKNGELDVRYYPYKNYFCKECGQDIRFDPTLPPIGLPSYRQLFSMLDTPRYTVSTKEDCKENEFYDDYQVTISITRVI